MIEIYRDIFKEIENHKDKLILLLITTNGVIKNNGELVMGAGLAKQACLKFKELELPKILGELVSKFGNKPYLIDTYNSFIKLISFPTKNNWKDKSKLSLIENSMKELANIINKNGFKDYVILSGKMGCMNGGLSWEIVKMLVEGFEISKNMVVCDINREFNE